MARQQTSASSGAHRIKPDGRIKRRPKTHDLNGIKSRRFLIRYPPDVKPRIAKAIKSSQLYRRDTTFMLEALIWYLDQKDRRIIDTAIELRTCETKLLFIPTQLWAQMREAIDVNATDDDPTYANTMNRYFVEAIIHYLEHLGF